eukprot:GFUD01041760.1.p1 GENE.GFUD01041760.1~~GFUD01041760.1.p1  ORF type:complete len:360 (+),score=42.18 GFUD01041760.1:83-1081(+)
MSKDLCCKTRAGRIPRREVDQSVTVMVGGWPESFSEKELSMDTISYSVVSPVKTCIIDIPPLPKEMMWKPLAQFASGHLMVCYMDYETYLVHQGKDYQCWSMDLDLNSKEWNPVQPPPHKLWYSASVAKGDKFMIVGGSREVNEEVSKMSGTTLVQEYDVRSSIWSLGPRLPFPLFEGCAVNTDRGIVVLGDFEGGAANSYILVDGKWIPLPLSIYSQTKPACAQVNMRNENVFMALSGENVEYFSFQEQMWIKIPSPLKVARSKYSTSTVGMSFGKLVISGGFDMDIGEVSDKIEIWDELGSSWKTSLGRKFSGRNNHAYISLPSDYLFCT